MIRNMATLLLALVTLISPLVLSAPATAQAEVAAIPFQDYGDAPDSTNRAGLGMTAYPGVKGLFPTVVQAGGPFGPFHTANPTRLRYILGYGVSAEENADAGADADGLNNLAPLLDAADRDARDDGVALPTNLPHCKRVQIQIAVTVFDRGQQFPEPAFVNLWLDFDRSGQWGEQKTCPDGTVAAEWAVANHAINVPAPGTHIITLPAFVAWNENPGGNMWMRATLSESQAPSADGSGQAGGYNFGETEDYWLESVGSPPPPAAVPPLQVGDFTASGIYKIHLPLVARPSGNDNPDDITTPSGNMFEVDVAHLGGTVNGPTLPLIVTVVGTGYAGRLSSWTTTSQAAAPIFLKDAPSRIGHDHQLHVLTPPTSPKLAHEMLVSVLIDNGNLWLTTWRVLNDGTFQELDTRGYGSNAGVTVDHYTIVHRPLVVTADEKRHQLVTPIVHDEGKLRLVTWEINAITGVVNGKSDSGDVAVNAAVDTDLAAIFATGEGFVGPHYSVSLRNASGDLATYLWEVNNAGVPTFRGSGVSGRDIQNAVNIVQTAQNVEIAPLADTGFLAAVNAGGGGLKLLTWENLVRAAWAKGAASTHPPTSATTCRT